jgi:hypothetical protein
MRLTLLGVLTVFSSLRGQTPSQSTDTWRKLNFLIDEWTGIAGEKDTPLGAGQGSFSFKPELKRKILVRRNNASYDSGAQHDDLMVIYADAPNDTPRAIYFDTEGHVIRYNLSFPSTDRVVFESEAGQPGPKYRLTYWMEGGLLKGRFEIAESESEYKTYLSWASKKR